MVQDHYSDTLARTDSRVQPGLAGRQPRTALILRHLVLSMGLALLFTCIEVGIWILNPAHLFGNSPHTLVAFFALIATAPLLWLLLLAQVALIFGLVRATARPLACLAYLKAVRQDQEWYRTNNTPLASWSYPYDAPLLYYQDDPDPTRPRQARSLAILELVEEVMSGATSHLLLLGEPGAGKTMFLHEYLSTAAQRWREFVFGRRFKLPVFLPLKYYMLFLQAFDLSDPADFSLFDFLALCDLPGLECLRPYLHKLFQQGRLLLLCDGLDEVSGAYRPALDQELILLMRQNRNALLLTCTTKVYEQSPELVQVVGENLIPRAVFSPLNLAHMRVIVERFIAEMDASYRPNLPTAGQVMAAIERTRLRLLCTTPFYLFALLEIIADRGNADPRMLDTRGRLLSAFLKLLENRAQANGVRADSLDFLGELACIARWQGDDSMLYVAANPGASEFSVRSVSRDSQREAFLAWAQNQRIDFPFAVEPGPGFSIGFASTRLTEGLVLAQSASLLDLSSQNVASFRHSLLASALLADYFARMLGTSPLDIDGIETFPDDLAPWSEPLTLWAGQLDQPLQAANILALYAHDHPEQRSGALVLSLICLGVAQTPPGVEQQQPLSVPPALETALDKILNNQRALVELAVLWMRCAERGSPELYQALFPLLALPGIEALLVLLDPTLVSELLFRRLVAVIDDVEQETLVKRLVRALSSWGEAVVPQAVRLATSGSNGRLRTAAINVLGGTRAHGAVEPLLTRLRDPDQFIVTRAANALARLGPQITLLRLLQELEVRAPTEGQLSLPWIILPILERFLNEPDAARQLTPSQNELIIDALMALLTTSTNAADLEKARAILVSQGRLAAERDSGKIALNMLVKNLTTADEAVAQSMSGTLKEVGQVATPHLLEQLLNQPAEAERVRILEVLASLGDPRALPTLLSLLEDDSLAVQQALAITLAVYVPTCIPGLINKVLRHTNELVAARAEQILSELGIVVAELVVQALHPQVAGRTHLLVHVLEHVRAEQATPTLIALLESSPTEVALTLALVQALGKLANKRAIRPLLTILDSDDPLLSEGALNALSGLGELACDDLLARLATPEKTPLVARIERVLLGMEPFAGERLLQAVDEGGGDQARYIEEVFLSRGADAAQLLSGNLFHARPRIREYARRTLGRMDGRYAVPALLEVLNRPDPAWRTLIASYLLKHPREAIPSLVGLLGDPERGEAAVPILLQAGASVLPELVPAMEASHNETQARARHILVTLVQQQPDLLADAVHLFGLALPPRAHELLTRILTEDLAENSLPALLVGLEDAHLVRDASETLVRLAHRNLAQSVTVHEQLLQALRIKARRYGASLTLIDLEAAAVPGVGALIADSDQEVAHAARYILGKIGTPALSFLWAAHSDTSDPPRREAAREVFRAMPTAAVKDELVELLTSVRQENISMALALLLERIHDEALQQGRAGEMLPALLDHVQSSTDERASLRILALLILLGGPAVIRALLTALYTNPQRHEYLVSAFLLLGQGGEAELHTALHDPDAPARVQAEIAGILAMRTPHKEAREQARSLSEHGLWAGRSAHSVTTVLQASQLEISLRALGGLLVAGHWDARELQDMRTNSKNGSSERELYDILLGWRYSPHMTHLEHELEAERDERKQELFAHTQELLTMKNQMIDLEHDLELLKQEHEEHQVTAEQRSKEFQDEIAQMNREKQDLQARLRQAVQEKQALAASAQQATQATEHLQAETQRWQTYSQQLEREITALRRPKPGA